MQDSLCHARSTENEEEGRAPLKSAAESLLKHSEMQKFALAMQCIPRDRCHMNMASEVLGEGE